MITIHNFARGARGVRVFWTCEEMGLPYLVATVSYPPSDAYLKLNPPGTVPFLGHALPDNLTAYRERLAARPAYERAVAAQSPAT